MARKYLTEEHKRKISISRKGYKPSLESIKKTKETIMRNGGYKQYYSFKKGHVPWNKNKKNIKTSGSNHWNWKGGKVKHQRGYNLIFVPEHPNCTKEGYVFEHRLIMEKKLGRYLTKNEVVHHIDENKINNIIDNLILYKNDAEHQKYHHKKIIGIVNG